MFQAHDTLVVKTTGRGLFPCTREVAAFVERIGATEGLLVVHIQHTSASLLVQENADPDVCGDLERFFARLVPDGDPIFRHDAEGPDDMPAHVRAALTQTQLVLPVSSARLALGTWQGLFVYEHRHSAHRRSLWLHYLGD